MKTIDMGPLKEALRKAATEQPDMYGELCTAFANRLHDRLAPAGVEVALQLLQADVRVGRFPSLADQDPGLMAVMWLSLDSEIQDAIPPEAWTEIEAFRERAARAAG